MASTACSTLLALTALPALAAAGPAPQGGPPVRYRVQVLGTMNGSAAGQAEQAVAINAHGEVVGQVTYAGRAMAAHWAADGELTLLYLGEPGASSFAFDLTDDGLAIGYSVVREETTPFQWSATSGTVLLDLGPGGVPLAVNEAHTIAYTFRSENLLASALRDASQATTPIHGLGLDVLVRDLNGAGAATGLVGGGADPARPFLWTASGGTVLLKLPSGFEHGHGNALNAGGVVVGVSRTDERDQATLWGGTSAAPTLLPYLRPENTQSTAFAVNSKGWVVGVEYNNPKSHGTSAGVIWIEGVAWDLDFLAAQGGVDPDLHISAALDINDKGQIAARGTIKGVERALRLDPW